MLERARRAGLVIAPSTTIAATSGALRIDSATTARLRPDGGVSTGDKIRCDALLMSGGLTPSVHLFSQSRGKLGFDTEREMYLPALPAQAQFSAGACSGVFDLRHVIESGYAAGASAARAAGLTTPEPRRATVTGAAQMRGAFAEIGRAHV